jgi:hypothetical protein
MSKNRVSKNRKKLAFAVAVLVTALIFIGVFLRGRPAQKPSPVPTDKVSPTPEALLVNFREGGNILNWDVQTESYTDEWTFLYEKPTNPAISVNLTFNKDSLCDMGDGYQSCDQSTFTNGDFVELEGNRVGGEVTVIRLQKVDLGIPIEP